MHRTTVLSLLAAVSLLDVGAAGAVPATSKPVKLADKITTSGHPKAKDKAEFKLSATVPKGDKLTGYALNFGDHRKAVKGSKVPKTTTHVFTKAGR